MIVFYTKFLPLIIRQGEVVRAELVLLGFLSFCFETGFHCVALAVLKLTEIHLPWRPA